VKDDTVLTGDGLDRRTLLLRGLGLAGGAVTAAMLPAAVPRLPAVMKLKPSALVSPDMVRTFSYGMQFLGHDHGEGAA